MKGMKLAVSVIRNDYMKKISVLLFWSLVIVLNGHSQFGKLSPADSLYWANIRKLTQLDYRNMLDQLHIDSTRPGPRPEIRRQAIRQILMSPKPLTTLHYLIR